MKKKLIAAVAALALVASVGAGATLAYLTDTTDAVVNTFTVGKVDIALDETVATINSAVAVSDNDGYNFSHVQPGDIYTKKPVVTVANDSEDCYVFVKLTNANSYLTTNMNTDSTSTNGYWISVGDNTYRWSKVLKAGDDVTVFSTVTVGDAVTEATEFTDITVVACAVQSANLSAEQAQAQAKFTK